MTLVAVPPMHALQGSQHLFHHPGYEPGSQLLDGLTALQRRGFSRRAAGSLRNRAPINNSRDLEEVVVMASPLNGNYSESPHRRSILRPHTTWPRR